MNTGGEQFRPELKTFLGAFYEVAKELKITGGNLHGLAYSLRKHDNSPLLQNEAASVFFEQHVTGWSRYDDWLVEQRARQEQDKQSNIRDAKQEDLISLLSRKKFHELKKFYSAVAGEPIKGRKQDVVTELVDLLQKKRMADRVQELERKRLVSEVERQYEITSSKKEMAELFAHRVMMLTYSKRRNEQLSINPGQRPWWLFDAVEDARTPEECSRLIGTVKRNNDPFWKDHPIPCGRLFCHCGIILLTNRQAEKYR